MPATTTGDFSGYTAPIQGRLPYLVGEVCKLRQWWEVYRHLFIEDQAFTKMMGEKLGALLGVFQTLLQDEMLLSIARLTDKDSFNQENLALWCLLDAIPYAKTPEFPAQLKESLNSIETALSGIRKHRHKRLAHFDLPVSIKSAILPPVTFSEIRMQIERMEAALNLVFREFANTTMLFDSLPASDVTGKAEVTVYKAMTYDLLERQGTIPKHEWRNRREIR